MAKKLRDLIVKLNQALTKIGHGNGLACPESQDPIDEVLHEYHVATVSSSYFDKRRKAAKEAMMNSLSQVQMDKIDDTSYAVADNNLSRRTSIAEGSIYDLNVFVKPGGQMLDEKLLRVALLRHLKADKVESILSESVKPRAQSIVYEVTEKDV